jgi:preprotein translocase subunit SecE
VTELGSPRDTGRTKKVALDELRKVVRPTRSELWNYTLVVIVFVTFMMAMVSGLDFGFSKLVGLVFGT